MPEKYRPIIEKIIKTNSRYSGNEDLLEDFCSETFKRCYKIIQTSDNIVNIEAYLSKVAKSSILDVLRTAGRLRRLKTGYTQIKTEPILKPYNTDENHYLTYDIEDPTPPVEEKLIKEEELELIRKALLNLDENYKDKCFIEIFKMRYIEERKQSEIAEALGISQGEVSKRLIELAKKVLSRLHQV